MINLDLETLQVIWFGGVLLLFAGYAILDGFDLGVGIIHLFAKKDSDRRVMLNAIGPVWDGNEVWLVTAGGALFATFPEAYATLFSTFYTGVMLLLCGLIFRAVAIEFRSKQPMGWWRLGWDVLFSLASLVITFALGLVLGNVVQGMPLDSSHAYTGSFTDFLNPYALSVGLLTIALFAMHGAIYILMKTDGELHDRIRGWINPLMIFFIIVYASVTMATLIFLPHMTEAFRNRPELFVLGIGNMLAIANIPREVTRGKDGMAFISSSVAILFLVAIFAVGIFPYLIRASNAVENSLTIFNSSSSVATLTNVLMVALLGTPLVVAYTAGIYWIFRGKVTLDTHSY